MVKTLLIRYGGNTEYQAFTSRHINKHIHVRQTEYLKDKRENSQKQEILTSVSSLF